MSRRSAKRAKARENAVGWVMVVRAGVAHDDWPCIVCNRCDASTLYDPNTAHADEVLARFRDRHRGCPPERASPAIVPG